MNILVFNCGSSSQNYKLYRVAFSSLELICKGKAHRVGVKGNESSFIEHTLEGRTSKVTSQLPDHTTAATHILDFLEEQGQEVNAIGHRFVNGGERYQDSLLITPEVSSGLDAVLPLAPIHNPNSLSVIRVCQRRFPSIPQTLSFDTAFHAGLEPAAYTYALPSELRQRFGLRKFGYHGLSYHYVTHKAAEYLGRPLESLRMVACHLGTGGSSVTAILNGRSLDTSMGYSPLAGLMMSTRSGDLDPEVMIQLLKDGKTPGEISNLLNKQSGLLGVSGISSDIRDLLGTEDDRATLAVELYTQRLKKTIAGFIALLGGIDVLLFTDDIGLQNPTIRALACRGLDWAGIHLDEQANLNAPVEQMSDIGQSGAPVRVLVTPTDEERVIADETLRLLTEA